jgi:serralysin
MLFTPNDLNGDGKADVLWRGADGSLVDWSMNGAEVSSAAMTLNGFVVTPDASWSIVGISDFSGGQKADILWRNSDGTLADWSTNGSAVTASALLTMNDGSVVAPDASWTVAGVGDFNGDGKSDILWSNSDGTLVDWTMNGSVISSSNALTFNGVTLAPDASWSVAGIGDFDGDHRADILWRNTSGELAEWQMNGSVITSSTDLTLNGVAIAPDASWSIAGIGDFNGDGNADILWRNTDGTVAVWLMNGSAINSSDAVTFNGMALSLDATWHLVETGDFNGDGQADVLWRNDDGTLAQWQMNGSQIVSSSSPASQGTPLNPDMSWQTQATPTNFA